jgi:phosphoribosylformylglycinamidine synthase
MPWCLTDCLNYGSPEDPEVFRQFRDGVRGVGDAAREIGLLEDPAFPVPVVSGNVSFYNQSTQGQAIPPSPIVGCFGILKDYAAAITLRLKQEGDGIWLVGPRRRELGGSAYWRHRGISGGTPPAIDGAEVRGQLAVVLDAIESGLVRACHDISEGGLAVAALEMAFGSPWGMRLEPSNLQGLRADEYLFTESGGFLMEIDPEHEAAFQTRCRAKAVAAERVGTVRAGRRLEIQIEGLERVEIDVEALEPVWHGALREAMR